MSNLARKIERAQARKAVKSASDPKELAKHIQSLPLALSALSKVSAQLDDAQTAIVQMLGELDAQDYEARRQRAVFLRMLMEVLRNPRSLQNHPEGLVTGVLEKEEDVRLEYTTMMALVSAFSTEEASSDDAEKEA